MNRAFERGSASRDALRNWWLGLEHDRGTRAELRRCGTTLRTRRLGQRATVYCPRCQT